MANNWQNFNRARRASHHVSRFHKKDFCVCAVIAVAIVISFLSVIIFLPDKFLPITGDCKNMLTTLLQSLAAAAYSSSRSVVTNNYAIALFIESSVRKKLTATYKIKQIFDYSKICEIFCSSL
uniref:Uncharacterized protein n=1 Tax=Glossina palpalis gambiensis TaxID=67801 RepID=A0A1B0BPQ9_9MUSC